MSTKLPLCKFPHQGLAIILVAFTSIAYFWRAFPITASAMQSHLPDAEPVRWTTGINLSNTANRSSNPAIAVNFDSDKYVDCDGKIHVVWTDQEGTSYQMFHRTWDGVTWSTPTPIDAGITSAGAIAMDSHNNLHLVYVTTTDRKLYYRTKDGCGRSWSDPMPIDVASSYPRSASIYIDKLDNIHIVWGDSLNSHYQVNYLSKIGPNWSARILVATDAYYPRFAVGGNGIIHFVWRSSTDYWARYRNFNGIQLSPIETASQGYINSTPQIAVDDTGIVHIAYSSQYNTSPEGAFYQNRSTAGVWSNRIPIAPLVCGGGDPEIAVDAYRHIHVIWNNCASSQNWEVMYSFSDTYGTTWRQRVNLSSSSNGSSTGMIVLDKNQQFYLTWTETNSSGYGEIYFSQAPWYPGTAIVSGRIFDNLGTPVPGVTVSLNPSVSTVTDTNGYYILNGLVVNKPYGIRPSKGTYLFSPFRRNVFVTGDLTGQDFSARDYGKSKPIPFLDLPFDYGGNANGFLAALKDKSPSTNGRINSWFDHKYPREADGNGILLYDGTFSTRAYDKHDGLDISYKDPNPLTTLGEGLILKPAASGVVVCKDYEEGGYGNYLVIYHQNDYFTLYGHMASISVTVGTAVTTQSPLGIMGNTGNSTGTHLHFSVHHDENGNGEWDGVGTDKPVDPFGWMPQANVLQQIDPSVKDRSGPPSYMLWIYDPTISGTFDGASGFQFVSRDGKFTANIAPNAYRGLVTIEIFSSLLEISRASTRELRRIEAYQLAIVDWIEPPTSPQQTSVTNNATSAVQNLFASDPTLPITITVNYTDTALLHLAPGGLNLYRWDEIQSQWITLTTTVNTISHTVTAQTTSLGNFSLEAPLFCPQDSSEVDDTLYASGVITPNGQIQIHLFDIAQDEDWFHFETITGTAYTIQTMNLAFGVDTRIEIYDTDGQTVLASDDNSGGGLASQLVWQAPAGGEYFIRVSQASFSNYGCDATYAVSIFTGPTATIISDFNVSTLARYNSWVNFTGLLLVLVCLGTIITFIKHQRKART